MAKFRSEFKKDLRYNGCIIVSPRPSVLCIIMNYWTELLPSVMFSWAVVNVWTGLNIACLSFPPDGTVLKNVKVKKKLVSLSSEEPTLLLLWTSGPRAPLHVKSSQLKTLSPSKTCGCSYIWLLITDNIRRLVTTKNHSVTLLQCFCL